jgi:succinate dehydrogenase/fumarate reductase cytochrome b subunit
MRSCPECGLALTSGALFCPVCGRRIEAAATHRRMAGPFAESANEPLGIEPAPATAGAPNPRRATAIARTALGCTLFLLTIPLLVAAYWVAFPQAWNALILSSEMFDTSAPRLLAGVCLVAAAAVSFVLGVWLYPNAVDWWEPIRNPRKRFYLRDAVIAAGFIGVFVVAVVIKWLTG